VSDQLLHERVASLGWDVASYRRRRRPRQLDLFSELRPFRKDRILPEQRHDERVDDDGELDDIEFAMQPLQSEGR
jgi:hypothetical protein